MCVCVCVRMCVCTHSNPFQRNWTNQVLSCVHLALGFGQVGSLRGVHGRLLRCERRWAGVENGEPYVRSEKLLQVESPISLLEPFINEPASPPSLTPMITSLSLVMPCGSPTDSAHAHWRGRLCPGCQHLLLRRRTLCWEAYPSPEREEQLSGEVPARGPQALTFLAADGDECGAHLAGQVVLK